MRSLILILSLAFLAFVSARPITPSAPPLRQRAEQYRLQGLREFEIAERLMTPPSPPSTSSNPANPSGSDSDSASDSTSLSSIPITESPSSISTLIHFFLLSSHSPSFSPALSSFSDNNNNNDNDDDLDDKEGDIPPGSLEAPQMLPSKAPLSEEMGSWMSRVCGALFKGRESSFAYEGKEEEMRRPTGMRHWKGSVGGFRR